VGAVCAGLVALAAPAGAESVFAREGLGEWNDGYDLRGILLGSTGIGTVDPNNLTTLNPASSAFAIGTLGHASFLSSVRWTDDGTATARDLGTNLNQVSLHLDFGRGFGLRVMAAPATDASYAFVQSVPTGFEEIETDMRREEGTRGLTRYVAGMAWRGGRNWGVGAQAVILAGSIVDHTRFVFGDSAAAHGWKSIEERRELRFDTAASFAVGLLARPLPRVSFGAFFSTGASPSVTETFRTSGEDDIERGTAEVDLPPAFGAGAAIFITPRWRLCGDVVQRTWEDVAIARPGGEAGERDFRNTTRWGIGLERIPAFNRDATPLASLVWRAGFAWIPWYVSDANGDGIDEWRATAGVGVPIQQNRGMIDIGAAYGRRGSRAENGLEEQYVSFALGFTFARVLREY